jgi:hypothetical protein
VTESELAFLALGLLLGIAAGAALLTAFGNRSGRREILVTVTRGAVPRRSGTLSQDAFAPSLGGPAPGGPGDRRQADRDDHDGAPEAPTAVPAALPAMTSWPAPFSASDRTPVPSLASAAPVPRAAPVAIAIQPEPDRVLRELRRRPAAGSALERMLRGEHLAMVEAVDEIAGADSLRRRSWEVLLGGLVEAMADVAVRESVIDFPMGTAFWDTFTVEQCRRIAGALASMGYRYDGQAGWADNRVPTYRDLAQALADVGVEPRRVRAWPNQAEIAQLFAGARPAPEELLAAAGPDYSADSMRALVGEHAAELSDLWLAWDSVLPALLREDDALVPLTTERLTP